MEVNQKLIRTNWSTGRDILDRQSEQGWGNKVIDRLSCDFRERYPDAKGYSPRNLKYMRCFAEAWPSAAMVQQAVAPLPMGHELVLLEKLNEEPTRIWYAETVLAEGWSRNQLACQIETRLHERSRQATSNFNTVLPSSTSAIVQDVTKDPYVFDFLELAESNNEREIEGQLLQHVERFLLKLGRGFAFVARQLRLDMAGDEFFPDLVFYGFVLLRFVMVELKVEKFELDHLGQLGIYMSFVDDLLDQPGDESTIGLLLSKTKNSVVAEYALRGFSSPIGVTEWAAEITDSLPEDVSRSLQSIDELEAELAGTDNVKGDGST
ncbi:putative nuclease of restriction endonuclease-like (RecB) superfamily [Arthrobacter sp. JUb115]|nr:putative nuclease of restriction endonuclease-like (RecB) superfamily [Arthrobacter sp. JUb115]